MPVLKRDPKVRRHEATVALVTQLSVLLFPTAENSVMTFAFAGGSVLFCVQAILNLRLLPILMPAIYLDDV